MFILYCQSVVGKKTWISSVDRWKFFLNSSISLWKEVEKFVDRSREKISKFVSWFEEGCRNRVIRQSIRGKQRIPILIKKIMKVTNRVENLKSAAKLVDRSWEKISKFFIRSVENRGSQSAAEKYRKICRSVVRKYHKIRQFYREKILRSLSIGCKKYREILVINGDSKQTSSKCLFWIDCKSAFFEKCTLLKNSRSADILF